jgi:tetratricopeptide (TPR) repeat protein/transcriptional regulator with XRE-family HTH domain
MPAVAEEPGLSFAGLLRQLRAEARLTQEELAEAAGVSPRSVSDVERGIHRTAHKDTAQLLAGALGLDGAARELFVAAARGKAPAAEVLAARHGAAPGAFAAVATRALPRDIAAFTGRQAELAQLIARSSEASEAGGVVSVHAIGGMAGIGKTAFAVHAAHQLAAGFPDGQFFLPLHAHTPGQQPVDPADALASLLLTAGVPAPQIPPGADARAARWRDYAAGKRILLVLDDAAGHEQVRPLLAGAPGSLVLITSRRRLAALEDAAVVSLDTLALGEAAGLLARLAARADVTASDPGVGQLAALCGYLPLAVGMAGRQLAHHPAWTPAGLAADLAAARDRLELMAAENVSVAAAFGLSYADLDDGQRRLFRRLGLHPGPDIDAHAAAALDDTRPGQARRGLEDLYDQYLITQPAPGRYRFHDLLRQHARALAATGDPADSGAAAGRLLGYYQQAALAAAGSIALRVRGAPAPPPARPPACAPPLSSHAQAARWLEAERANLHAAAADAAARGHHEQVAQIAAAIGGFLFNRGYWDQVIALQRTALAAARRAGDRAAQAAALNQLCLAQGLTGDNQAAVASQRQALDLYRDLGDRRGQGDALHSLGLVHQRADDYPASAVAAGQALELYRGAGDRMGQGDALTILGFAHLYAGDYSAAAAAAQQALDLFRDLGDKLGQGTALEVLGGTQVYTGCYPAATVSFRQALGLFREAGDRKGDGALLVDLGDVQRLTGDYPAATASYQQALKIFRDIDDRAGAANALNELGTLQRIAGDYPAAAASYQQALQLYRAIANRNGQAYVLGNLGALHTVTGDYPAAAASLRQALELFRDTGRRQGQAETLNNLGELVTRSSASHQARDHYAQALAIARDLGTPLEQARALEGIGNSCLHDGHSGQAGPHLQQALTIYQRIGAPAAPRVQQTIHDHRLTSITPQPQPAVPNSEAP